MIQIYGDPGPEPGDQHVYRALQHLTPDFLVYAQPLVVHRQKRREPDYIIVHPSRGVIVLEVKDWLQVKNKDSRRAQVFRTETGRLEWDTSPVDQAKGAAYVLVDRLKQDSDLRNYAGKLDFPFRYAGALPHLPMATISWLEDAWGENYLLGRDDLKPERIVEKIMQIPAPFDNPMTERQFNAVRAIIDERNIVRNHKTGRFKGVYNQEQEGIARAPIIDETAKESQESEPQQATLSREFEPIPLVRQMHLESEIPEESVDIIRSSDVRLVRGFAGTGKTDVLILRVHYLVEQNPDNDILVTTFNRPLLDERLRPELNAFAPQVKVCTFDSICSNIYQKQHGQWNEPQKTRGLLTHMSEENSDISRVIDKYSVKFLQDEIIWMKEAGLTERDNYVVTVREGRGGQGGRSLSRRMKSEVFDVFEAYEDRLADIPAYDWVDLHDKALKYLKDGVEPDKRYDVILIDEAQHFAPSWMGIIKELMKPTGGVFICDDPSQSVYRFFSWRQRGVEVVGRTRWLRIPYRNTRQIFRAAYALISENPLAIQLLGESGEAVSPDLENDMLRDGERPEVHNFNSISQEKEFVQREVLNLFNSGLLPEEICVLHTKRHVRQTYTELLPPGVQVDEPRRQTGMEYKAVIIPRIQDLFERDIERSWEQDQARQQIMFYMTMARARDHLYLLYGKKWPKQLDAIRPYVDWH